MVVRVEVVSSAGAVDATPGPVLVILQSVNETLHLQTGGACPGSETPTGDNPRDARAALHEA
ncbi:MAG: hypothetical protein P8182_13150, partial [Deltaproteobacteria bacterium]